MQYNPYKPFLNNSDANALNWLLIEGFLNWTIESIDNRPGLVYLSI